MNVARIHDFAYRCHRKRIPLIPKIIGRMLRLLYHCEIPYSACIHPSVEFAHKALGVVVGHDAIIGKGTKILHNVTIGGRGGRKDSDGRSNPRIGENVLIGAGACLLGPIEIANDVQIGANAVVLHSVVEEGALVVEVPAEIQRRKKEI